MKDEGVIATVVRIAEGNEHVELSATWIRRTAKL
jgi:hypothetical protein